MIKANMGLQSSYTSFGFGCLADLPKQEASSPSSPSVYSLLGGSNAPDCIQGPAWHESPSADASDLHTQPNNSTSGASVGNYVR